MWYNSPAKLIVLRGEATIMDKSQTAAGNKISMLTVLLIFISFIILIALITPSVNSSVKKRKSDKSDLRVESSS